MGLVGFWWFNLLRIIQDCSGFLQILKDPPVYYIKRVVVAGSISMSSIIN